METLVNVLLFGEVALAGLLLSVVITLGKNRKELDNLNKGFKSLTGLALKSNELFKLIAEALDKKKNR